MFAKIIAKLRDRRSFRQVALDYFRDEVGDGYVQRIDGIACFSPLRRFWFWRVRLIWMVLRGDLMRKPTPSIWKDFDGMWSYGLPARNASTT